LFSAGGEEVYAEAGKERPGKSAQKKGAQKVQENAHAKEVRGGAGKRKKRVIKVGGRQLDFMLAAAIREMPGWNTTQVVRKVAELAGRDMATVWRHLRAARQLNLKQGADEMTGLLNDKLQNRADISSASDAAAGGADDDDEAVRKQAQEVNIAGLPIFRAGARAETVVLITAQLKDIEKSIGRKLSARDVGALRQLADAYDGWVGACETLEAEGNYFQTDKGAILIHPAHKLKKTYYDTCMCVMKQYGLTMYARDRIKAFGGEDGGDTGGFDLPGMDFED
jgi:P27 family predicted phage terminase small subunit